MRSILVSSAVLLFVLTSGPVAPAADADASGMLLLHTRSRVESPRQSGQFEVVYKPLTWDPKQTAIVICDMWDDHYCRNAARRVAEMAPRMNKLVAAARKRGVLIIHSPSGTMDVYKDTPERKLALEAPKAELPTKHKGWAHLDPKREPPLPVDTSTPCDDVSPRKAVRMFSRQNDLVSIEPGDAIGDGVEIFNLLDQRGIKNVILMGVHTNMCVLGRPFGIRNMVYQGKNLVLCRDMTDAMYSPKCKPYVSHVRGTELVIEHIEKYWCPTITGSDFLPQAAFRFKQDDRPHVVFLVNSNHYDADKTLAAFAHLLCDRYHCYCTILNIEDETGNPGLEAIKAADCLVVFVRRRTLPEKQMAMLRAYLAAGKPLVALRTASHAFAVKSVPEGHAQWKSFDPEVLGGNYHGHGSNKQGTDVAILPGAAGHPILAGVKPAKWHSAASLYRVSPIDAKATVLLTGSLEGQTEPLAWTRSHRGGRVFYTGLGHQDDFQTPQFRRLLVNGIFWAMDRPVPEVE